MEKIDLGKKCSPSPPLCRRPWFDHEVDGMTDGKLEILIDVLDDLACLLSSSPMFMYLTFSPVFTHCSSKLKIFHLQYTYLILLSFSSSPWVSDILNSEDVKWPPNGSINISIKKPNQDLFSFRKGRQENMTWTACYQLMSCKE